MVKYFCRFKLGKLLFFWMILCLASLLTAGSGSAIAGIPKVSGGNKHSIAVDVNGTVWAWGYNNSGQLGDGTTTDKSFPIEVDALTDIVDVAAGGYHNLAVDADGKVWSWGDNSKGQLGDGTTTDRKTPVVVNGLTNVTAVDAGEEHSIALKSDGTVWAWGNNEYGVLGDGTTTDRSTIVKVSGLTDIISIAAGHTQQVSGYWAHSLAVKSDGTAWAWGYNEYGQLGNGESGSNTKSTTPIQMINMNNADAVAAGYSYSIVLTSDGNVWACGRNNNGQLGNGSNDDSNILVQVAALSEITSVTSGASHSIAIKTDGTLWAWGYNDKGQLGDGSAVTRNSPVQVVTINVNQPATTPTPTPSASPTLTPILTPIPTDTPALSTGFITGTVVDAETGIGIAGATIQTDTGGYSATTDASGGYQLEVGVGIYTITATAEGYETASKTVTVSENTIATADFNLKEITSNSGDLSGRVTDADTGLGIAGATISDSAGNYTGTTDSNGFYQITDIPAGSYIFNASSLGYEPESVSGVIIVAGETTVLDFILETAITNASGFISGRVTDADTGLGIEGATVQTDSGSYVTTTGANGSYLLPDVTVGTYTLTASAEGYEVATENGVVVTENAITTVNFAITEIVSTGHIIGVVTDADTGVGIEGATVKTTDGGYETTTDASGSYQLEGVKAGSYTLEASANAYETATRRVTVSEDAITLADFSLEADIGIGGSGGIIFGAVEDEYEDPFQGVEVTIEGTDSYSDDVKTDEDGDYAFYNLDDGRYTLTFEEKGYETQTVTVNIEEGEVYEVETIEMEPEPELGMIYGFVYDIYGDPIEEAKVTVKNVVTNERWKEYVDADGYFEIKELDPGTYKVKVKKKKYKAYKETVTLEEEEEYDLGDVELRKSSRSRSDNVEVEVFMGVGL